MARELTEEELRRAARSLNPPPSPPPAGRRAVSGREGDRRDVSGSELARQGVIAHSQRYPTPAAPTERPAEGELATVARALNPPPELARDRGGAVEPIPNRRGERNPRPPYSGPDGAELQTVARSLNEPPEMRRDRGPTTEPIANRRGERSGPTKPAAAAPAPPAPASATPAPAPRKPATPGPAPATVAAERGAMGPPKPEPNVPHGTQPAAAAEPDKPAFSYLAQVEAMERKAMELGRPEEAARVRAEYNRLIEGQYRTLETDFKTKTLPQVQAMQAELLKYQGQQLPAELRMKARDVVTQAAQQQQQMIGFMYGLVRNDTTKSLGIQYFNDSELIEPGVKLADVVVEDGMIVGLDAQGGVVRLSDGSEFRFPVEAAEQLYEDLFGAEKDETIKLGEGEVAFDPRSGRQIASNPRSQAGTPSEQLASTKAAVDGLKMDFGATRDPVTNMIDETTIKDRASYSKAAAEVEQLVLEGMPPYQAYDIVSQKYRAQGASAATTATGGYDGPLPWRR